MKSSQVNFFVVSGFVFALVIATIAGCAGSGRQQIQKKSSGISIHSEGNSSVEASRINVAGDAKVELKADKNSRVVADDMKIVGPGSSITTKDGVIRGPMKNTQN